MKEYLFRIIGKVLAIIGIPLFVFISIGIYFAAAYTGVYEPSPLEVVLLLVYWLLDISMICIGVFLLRRYKEHELFLAKGGEPIHSAIPWKKGSEPGLYLTSCGLVVSINQESKATAHVGYKLVPAKRATHKDCIQIQGKIVLDSIAKHRSW